MVDVSERMKGIKALEVMKLCKKFIGKPWEQVNEGNFQLTPLTVGFGNRLVVCGLKDGSPISVTPEKVLVRYYGGNFLPKDIPGRQLTEAGEVLLFYAWGETGYGPKLLGAFEGGRIEEFIPSRILTTEEFANDPQVAAGLARALARYHSLTLPAPFPNVKEKVAGIRALYAKYLSIRDTVERPPPISKLHKRSVDEFLNWDVLKECDWIEKVSPLISTRVVLCHGDVNRGNTLFKLQEKDSNGQALPMEKRLVLVDVEFSGYGHRGADIGNHFLCRVYDFGQTIWLTKKAYASEKQRRHFIRNYLARCKEVGAFDNWDEDGLDSEDHVLLESQFWFLEHQLSTLTWLLSALDLYWKMHLEFRERDPEFQELGGMGCMVKYYFERKADFIKTYPQFDL